MDASQQARERERTDKLDRCGSQQATASRREKEASRWKPAGGRWKPASSRPPGVALLSIPQSTLLLNGIYQNREKTKSVKTNFTWLRLV